MALKHTPSIHIDRCVPKARDGYCNTVRLHQDVSLINKSRGILRSLSHTSSTSRNKVACRGVEGLVLTSIQIHEALESHAKISPNMCKQCTVMAIPVCPYLFTARMRNDPPNVRLTNVLTLDPDVVEVTRNLESESKLCSHKTRFTSRGARCKFGALILIARHDSIICRRAGVPHLPLSEVIKVDHPFMGQGLSQCLW